jgi:hypothetical protein
MTSRDSCPRCGRTYLGAGRLGRPSECLCGALIPVERSDRAIRTTCGSTAPMRIFPRRCATPASTWFPSGLIAGLPVPQAPGPGVSQRRDAECLRDPAFHPPGKQRPGEPVQPPPSSTGRGGRAPGTPGIGAPGAAGLRPGSPQGRIAPRRCPLHPTPDRRVRPPSGRRQPPTAGRQGRYLLTIARRIDALARVVAETQTQLRDGPFGADSTPARVSTHRAVPFQSGLSSSTSPVSSILSRRRGIGPPAPDRGSSR